MSDDGTAKVKINSKTGEIDIEGSETFVRDCLDRFSHLLAAADRAALTAAGLKAEAKLPLQGGGAEDEKLKQEEGDTGSEKADAKSKTFGLPDSFGEYLTEFPTDISDIDKVLVAGYYQQRHNEANTFSTRNANELLKHQGIKVANASWCVKQHMEAKRVFATEKGKFRVSRDGERHVESLRRRKGDTA